MLGFIFNAVCKPATLSPALIRPTSVKINGGFLIPERKVEDGSVSSELRYQRSLELIQNAFSRPSFSSYLHLLQLQMLTEKCTVSKIRKID